MRERPVELWLDTRLDALLPDESRSLMIRRPEDGRELRDRVAGIIQRVRDGGEPELRALARELDGVELDRIEIPRGRWERALEELDPEVRKALGRARDNIRAFHEAQLPGEIEMEVEPGVRLGRRHVPLDSVGVYAPGGRASYPSSVLMGVVPARVAGVEVVVVCSPPRENGEPAPAVMAAAALGGAHRLFALGGAGAVAALAYGAGSVPPVRAIVGPGNRWVTEAKRQVAGDVATDAPAGPSEVLIVAAPNDEGEHPGLDLLTAREMIAQAEHDPDAAAVVVSPSATFLEGVRDALGRLVADSPRRRIVEASLAAHGACLQARDLDEALEFAERYAPEHLALYVPEPRKALERIRSAGSVFLGRSTSVALGDYLTGANHVLPTGGLARSFPGLSVDAFLRAFTWQEASPEGAAAMAGDVARLARAEGLPGHAAAAEAREGEVTSDAGRTEGASAP